jgi:hypothetical protein
MATSWNERRLIAFHKHSLARVYVDIGRSELAYQMAEEARDLDERLGGMTMRLSAGEDVEKICLKMAPAHKLPEAPSVDRAISSNEMI